MELIISYLISLSHFFFAFCVRGGGQGEGGMKGGNGVSENRRTLYQPVV